MTGSRLPIHATLLQSKIEIQKSKIPLSPPHRNPRPTADSPLRSLSLGREGRVRGTATPANPKVTLPHNTKPMCQSFPGLENPKRAATSSRKWKMCLDCGSPLPPVPPHSLRRPDDHCPSCGMRLARHRPLLLSPASITASTAAQTSPPSYPAANALVLTATNAANVSTTQNLRHNPFNAIQFSLNFNANSTCNSTIELI